MWFAVDKDGGRFLHWFPPDRNLNINKWVSDGSYMNVDESHISADLVRITWEDEPVEVEIRRKQCST